MHTIYLSASLHNVYKFFISFRIIKNNGGTPPLTYKKFLAIIRSLGSPEHPVPSLEVQLLTGCSTPVSEDHEEKFGVPSLEELGLDVKNIPVEVWHGGEKEALVRLDRHLERKVNIRIIAKFLLVEVVKYSIWIGGYVLGQFVL